MTDEPSVRIRDDEIAYRLELTAREMKVTHTALRSLLNDFGHDEHDVAELIRGVLHKLPPANTLDSIDLGLPRRRYRV